MERYHFINEYLVDCRHLITVQVIGCGGSGSQMLTNLAKIHLALVKTGRQGLYVEAYDNDVVTEANIARQSFFPSDIGTNKAVALISRLNRSIGLQWKAFPDRWNVGHSTGWNGSSFTGNYPSNIIITCVDNIWIRTHIEEKIEYMKNKWRESDLEKPLYWLDMGNTRDTGQVVLGTIFTPAYNKELESKRKLLRTTEMFDYSKMEEDDSGPSCSTMEALNKQNLFVNSEVALAGAEILWELLFEYKIKYHGAFINLKTGVRTPIPV